MSDLAAEIMKAVGPPTAITLYFCPDCGRATGHRQLQPRRGSQEMLEALAQIGFEADSLRAGRARRCPAEDRAGASWIVSLDPQEREALIDKAINTRWSVHNSLRENVRGVIEVALAAREDTERPTIRQHEELQLGYEEALGRANRAEKAMREDTEQSGADLVAELEAAPCRVCGNLTLEKFDDVWVCPAHKAQFMEHLTEFVRDTEQERGS